MKLLNIATRNAAGDPIQGSVASSSLLASVLRILENTSLCSMATVDSAHCPHINTAYFAYASDLSLCFLSHPSSLHCRNLSATPSMAVSVFSSLQKWGVQDCGLQLLGACTVARGRLFTSAQHLYATRFPAYKAWRHDLSAHDLGREYRFYRFRPTALAVLDEKHFGDGVIVSARLAK